MSLKLRTEIDSVVLTIRAQPKSRRNAIIGVHDGALKIAVTAAPEKGEANKAILETLAKELHLAKSSVQLLKGAASSLKVVRLIGNDSEQLARRLRELAAALSPNS